MADVRIVTICASAPLHFPIPLLKLVRRLWVAARRDDEQERLVKEDEGLAVKKLPKAAPELMRRSASGDNDKGQPYLD